MEEVCATVLSAAWRVVVGVCTVATGFASVFIIVDQLRPFVYRQLELRRQWPWIIRRPRWARTLARLMRVLASVDSKLTRAQNDILLEEIRRDLNGVMWSIWVEVMSCVALRSTKESERCLALRNLSQVDDLKTMSHVMDVVKGVLSDLDATPHVRQVAKAALKELKKRTEMTSGSDESKERTPKKDGSD